MLFFIQYQNIFPKRLCYIYDQSLADETSIRYLGVYRDSNIIGKSHINYIAKKSKEV